MSRMMNDQFSPKSSVSRDDTNITPMKPILCLYIGVSRFIFFLNFMENMGISDTSNPDSTNEHIGMKNLLEAHPYSTLDGSFVT